MKGSIRKYCNEGHNILTASDMHDALKERQVKGSTAAVCEITRTSTQEIKVNRIGNFSAFHNFSHEESGLCVSKAYGVGPGKLIPWSEVFIKKQGPTLLREIADRGFFPVVPRVIKQHPKVSTDSENEEAVFHCEEPGCMSEFSTFGKLQDHIHFGQHGKSETSSSHIHLAGSDESTTMGWAIQKPRGSGLRFSENVKSYLYLRDLSTVSQQAGRLTHVK